MEAHGLPVASQRLQVTVGVWALAGMVCGALLSVDVVVDGTGPARAVLIVAGLATGAVIGLSGLAAVSAGLLAYAICGGVAAVLEGGGGGSGSLVPTAWIVMVTGTGIAISTSFWVLLGAGARHLVRRRLGPSESGAEPVPGAAASAPAASAPAPAAAPAPPVAPAAGVGDTTAGLRTSKPALWALYWLLAVVIFPASNLLVDVVLLWRLGPAVLLLAFPLLIAGEGVSLRRLVRKGVPGRDAIGFIAAAGLVFAATVLWSFVLVLIALSTAQFTF